ncbi:MAG TPA: ATP-binding cassette domain-containing protein, partial [Gammaproteobacteria bacterium]|nr:ATP-binding cassette domain-containing protein [Gammaproteobacteria bacterium]
VRASEREILDRVDLSVFRGEIVTLIGLNGAGKSTLARVLLGLTKPDEGQVRRKPGLKIGYSPQHLQRDPALPISVRRFLNLDAHHDEDALAQVLDDVGAAEILDTPLSEISGGELHRILLARSVLRHPDLLVLDEPLAGVDVTSQSDLYRVISDIRDRYHCGVLLVSHDLHVVMAATDRVVCLNHHVCCTGHPHAITSHPQFVALFGRQVADVIAVYAHSHDHAHDADGHPVPFEKDTGSPTPVAAGARGESD